MSDLTISVPIAAKRLGVSKATMYTLARRSDFPSFNVGNRILIYTKGLEDWVKAQAEKSGGAYATH